MAEGHVEVDGGRLWYESEGDGAAVVLIHSGLADSRQWDDQMRTLPSRYRTIRYDQRAYGRSDPPTGSYSSVDDLAGLLDALEVRSAALVGVSQGGGIALALAQERPDLPWALVGAATGGVGFDQWTEATEAAGEAMDAAVEGGDMGEALRIAGDLWLRLGRFPHTDERVAAMLADVAEAWRIPEDWERWPEPRALERLGEVRAPTLVVLPEHDIPEVHAVGELLAAGIAGARSFTVPGTDHLVNVRNPAGFDRVVLDFLQEVSP
ncbi:MAG: alpha/beta fold hydrolase [Actinomycetota bacterium]|nr:alpha/beta fold hydrolase [Actinomycetota bacterium]